MRTKTFLTRQTLIIGSVIHIFIYLLLLSNDANSQNNFSGSAIKINDSCNLVSFTGKRVEQVNYINCTVRSAIKGYFLVLEKSNDGETFSPLEIKKGQVSPGNQVLLFSFMDGSSTATTIYKICAYKLSITKEGEQKYLNISENILKDFENSTLRINVLENETQQEFTASWK
ncbi:MAG: hypothetical protein A3F72_18420 [Bacteroidetes bacterium RIFCSPLOWO2_12_FULL_35_15]|nr:MAG: hypothetical protein A3F72_18420 [Bacteroidetes bacterium RIFCSPLOWO2_12_FULL_35_15]